MGSSGTFDGTSIALTAGAGYSTSGNGNGGDLLLRSGLRRTAGSGGDGSITIDSRTGTMALTGAEITSTAGDVPGDFYSSLYLGEQFLLYHLSGSNELSVYPELNLQYGLVIENNIVGSSYTSSNLGVVIKTTDTDSSFATGGGSALSLLNISGGTDEYHIYLTNEFKASLTDIRFSVKYWDGAASIIDLLTIDSNNDLEAAVYGPLKLASYVTGSLPVAANHEGCIVYDTTTNTIKWSNGSVWATI